MTDRTVTDVVNQFRKWKRVGFCIMVTMGILLGSLGGREVCSQSVLLGQNG